MIELLVAIIWFFVGALGFCYWWRKDHDLEFSEIPFIIGCGFVGPLSWLIGWIIHAEPTMKTRVLWKRRQS
jgi:hypothetical protein